MKNFFSELSEKERKDLLRIAVSLRGLRYGSLQVVVHDSVVVQIERTEKYRRDNSKNWDYEI